MSANGVGLDLGRVLGRWKENLEALGELGLELMTTLPVTQSLTPLRHHSIHNHLPLILCNLSEVVISMRTSGKVVAVAQ